MAIERSKSSLQRAISFALALSFIACSSAIAANEKDAKTVSAGSAQAVSPDSNKNSAKETKTANPLLLLLVYDDSCSISCNTVRPVIRELAEKHSGKLKYAELNISDQAIENSRKQAKELGVSAFLETASNDVPVVAIFNSKLKKVKNLPGVKTRDVYTKAVEQAVQ